MAVKTIRRENAKMKSIVLISIFFQLEGIYVSPAVEFPTLESCLAARERVTQSYTEDTGIPHGTNFKVMCIKKDFSLMVEGTNI